jgi:hypothetical protein
MVLVFLFFVFPASSFRMHQELGLMVLLVFPLQGRRAEDGSVIDYELIDQDARVCAKLHGVCIWRGCISHNYFFMYNE